jgi:acid phosphatase family membrane protein YuiD
MYDATGVRRATGEHAKILNRMLADMTSGDPVLAEAGLKELIGHTPFQVFMGAILGIIIPYVIPLM